ncbi:Uncharacterised protein [Serratia marcescens]|nr:hypothetical protein [Serratia marcescens]ELA7784007.1 hypothetical protein [Serratia marcescens]MBH2971141.1 hypothetical protein [Serratia marcescens]MBH3244189.1 hypothetical protein [Serratia marcescens]MBN5412633.1 hypothetical protein [Serratia marcescens]MBN6138817.1 hypothetical protein [Serratia marcescens]
MRHSPLHISLAMVGLLLLNGCQSTKISRAKTTVAVGTHDEKTLREIQDLKQCQQNLNALGALKTVSYPAKKRMFDELMSSASQYAGIRAQVNELTQDTVDALYRYQVNYQCAEINQILLAELAKRGGVPSR